MNKECVCPWLHGSETRISRLSRAFIGLGAISAGLLMCASAQGVVAVDGSEMPRPDDGYVGQWNGSSGVPVSAYWFITAKHVGGSVNGNFYCQGNAYQAVEIIPHPTMDLQLIRVATALPGYHELADDETIEAGLPCVLGGYGVTAGTPVSDGWSWDGVRKETWGANSISSPGALLAIEFDRTSSASAVPHEALFAVNDSGGGLFVYDENGNLRLAGIAVSVTGWGATRYGNAAYALNVAQLHNWIMPIVDPGRPIASSVEAPGASLGASFVGCVMVLTLSTLSRRRKR